MNFNDLKNTLKSLGEPSYRFQQIVDNIQQTYADITPLSKQLREKLDSSVPYSTWKSTQIFTSQDKTQKAALTLQDNQVIETVLMQPKPNHWSICISCEVGCPMNCAFCATGGMGFKRLLTAEEIADQVLFWKQSGVHVNSIVFMGMGEPFHNQSNVFQAVEWINKYYGIGYRHISVSTCGIPEGIQALSETYPQVNLAISLHSADNDTRSKLMPINRQTNLTVLAESINRYIETTNREVMFEYLLIQDLNDTREAAQALVLWLKKLPRNLVHVNIIRYNETDRGFISPSINRVRWFKEYLESKGISASIRKSLGIDIAGACGQLAAKQTYNTLDFSM